MRQTLVGLVVLAACSDVALLTEERTAPFDLVMEDRVVLTPGHSITVPIEIRREEPDPAHPVKVELAIGQAAGGLTVTLDTANTKDDHAALTVTASATAVARELTLTLDGKLGLYTDREQLTISVQIPSPSLTSEEYAPGVSGVWKTLTVGGRELEVQIINGLAIVNGDIVLGTEAQLRALGQLRSVTCNPFFHTDFACSKWDNGVIGYTFADDWGGLITNNMMRDRIEAAMREWTKQTGIIFVPRASGQTTQFRSAGGCSSNVGRTVLTGEGPQHVNLSAGGCGYGVVLHEIGHTIGLYHEQGRDDRDDFVVIDWGRIQEDQWGQYWGVGEYSIDRGPYDYDSIMHYEPWAFVKNRAACRNAYLGLPDLPSDIRECAILPTDPAAPRIGQRNHISEGDIFGVYTLYPPQFHVGGAAQNATGDYFELSVDWVRGRPGVDRIVWWSDRLVAPVAFGNSFTLRAEMVPPGTNVLTAKFYVAGQVMGQAEITLNIANQLPAPVIEVPATADLNLPIIAIAHGRDPEDPTCLGCRYEWSPTPVGVADGRAAQFQFASAGPHPVTVTVIDRGGARASATTIVNVVDSAPTVTITRPTDGAIIADDTSLLFRAEGTDINTGTLPCSALSWSSSNPADELSTIAGCRTALTVHGDGPRTITVVATDGVNTSSDSVSVTVVACADADCPPVASFDLGAPHTSGAYLIERELSYVLHLSDTDGMPLDFQFFLRRVGETTRRMIIEGIPLQNPYSYESTVTVPLDGWPLCSQPDNYRDYELVLEVTDSTNHTTTFTRTVTFGCDLI